MTRTPGRPPTLEEAGRWDVEDALSELITLIHEEETIMARTNPAPAAHAPYPNGAVYWHAERTLTRLLTMHSALGRRHAAITALLQAARRAHEE